MARASTAHGVEKCLVLKWSESHWTARAIIVVALTMSCFHLWVAYFGPPNAMEFRALHLGFVLVLAFLMMPGFARRTLDNRLGPVDYVLLLGALACTAYPIISYDYFTGRIEAQLRGEA